MHLLRNADLYTPTPRGISHLLIGGGRVLWVGSQLPDLPGALDVQVRDLGGARVIPGLIDPHVHVTGGGGEAGPGTKVPPLGISRFTRHGVTTVIGLLGTDDATRHPRELVAAVAGLRQEGLGAWCWTAGYHFPPVTVTGSVRGDIAAIDPIIGAKTAISDHRSSQPTLEELLRLASEAHVGGLMTDKAGIVHLHVGDGPRGLALIREALATSELPARVFNPTHVNRRRALFEEALALAKGGSHVDVTAFPVAEGEDAWDAATAVVRFLDSGAPPDRLTVSSDGGGCLPVFDGEGRVTSMGVGEPGMLPETLAQLVGRGVPMEIALGPFTRNAARLYRLPRKGELGVGMDADLVVLDSDGRTHDVMCSGAWHVLEGAVQHLGAFETESS